MTAEAKLIKYHLHLRDCRQCEKNPFEPCAIGAIILTAPVDDNELPPKKGGKE